MERIQNLKSDVAVFSERCCRVSYGIVVRQVYNPARHQGEDIVLDPLDKRKWAESQVHWLIRQVCRPDPGAAIQALICTGGKSICRTWGEAYIPVEGECREREGDMEVQISHVIAATKTITKESEIRGRQTTV